MKSFLSVLILSLILFSCGDSSWEGVYVIDKDAFQNSPELKAQKRAGDDMAVMMMKGVINKIDYCVIVKGDSVFTFSSFNANSSYAASPLIKEEKGISFLNEQGTKMMLMKGDTGLQVFNGVMNLPVKKLAGEEKEKYNAQLKQKKEEAALRSATEKKLASLIEVKLIDKGFYERNYQEYITFSIEIKNTSGRDITALKGILIISDLLDNQLKRISFMYDDGLAKDATTVYEGTIDYNRFDSDAVSIKNKSLDKLRVVWVSEQVLFSDGEKIGE